MNELFKLDWPATAKYLHTFDFNHPEQLTGDDNAAEACNILFILPSCLVCDIFQQEVQGRTDQVHCLCAKISWSITALS